MGVYQVVLEVVCGLMMNSKEVRMISQVVTCLNGKIFRKCGKQKTRGEVNYSTRKLRVQKGMGMARIGSRGSPIMVGGGRVFPSVIRAGRKKVNKKVLFKCVNILLRELLKEGKIMVTKSIGMDYVSTKRMIKFLGGIGMIGLRIVMVGKINSKVMLACRNIKGVNIVRKGYLVPNVLVNVDRVIIVDDGTEWV